MNISSNISASLLSTLYQSNMSLYTNKLNRNYFPKPSNNAGGSSSFLASDAVSYVNNLRASSDSLSSVLRELSSPSSQNRIVAISSSPNSVSVQYTGKKPENIKSMTLQVGQIAAGQMNEGSRMVSDTAFEGTIGTSKFSIEMGGKATQVSVNVRKGDTNAEVQQKMADAINNSGAGVKATVETDSKTNVSMLRIESATTGSDPKNAFSLVDKSGGLVGHMGANDIARKGRDAIYSVNGGAEKKSQSNTVSIGNGVTATFNKASEETVTITWGHDANATKSTVEDLVKSYNNLYSIAAERTDDPRAQSLATKMVKTSGTYTKSLSNIGIGFDDSGRMKINSEKLNQAAESGKLDQFFKENSGKNYGFTNQLGRLADSVSRNTGSYVSSSMFGGGLMGNSGYTDFGLATQFNFFNAGSIFDFMM